MSNAPEFVRTPPDEPLLVFKIGMLGCFELDVMERVAGAYDAVYLSSDRIRRQLASERLTNGISTDRIWHMGTSRIKDIAAERAASGLALGKNVVLDMFFNSPKSRELACQVAQEAGALSVALWANTRHKVALERVKRWETEQRFAVPAANRKMTPLATARNMMHGIVAPSREGIDIICRVDGGRSTDEVLAAFEHRVQQQRRRRRDV